jgi:hypothetical protein
MTVLSGGVLMCLILKKNLNHEGHEEKKQECCLEYEYSQELAC